MIQFWWHPYFNGFLGFLFAFGSLFVGLTYLDTWIGFYAGAVAIWAAFSPRQQHKVHQFILVLGLIAISGVSWISISYYYELNVEGNYNPWGFHLLYIISLSIVLVELARPAKKYAKG
jgi:hypothetical protein